MAVREALSYVYIYLSCAIFYNMVYYRINQQVNKEEIRFAPCIK